MKKIYWTLAVLMIGLIIYIVLGTLKLNTLEAENLTPEQQGIEEIENSPEWGEIAAIMKLNIYLKQERKRITNELHAIEVRLLNSMEAESDWLSKNYYESTGDLPIVVREELSAE